MNRKDFEKAVDDSTLNSAARHILMTYARHQQYKDDGTDGVWPAKSTIADKTGYSADTVGKYVEELISAGWLEVIGFKGEGNKVKVVSLETGECTSRLLTSRRPGQSHKTLTKQPISYPLGDASPTEQETHLLTYRSASPNVQERTTIEQQEEQSIEQPSTSADATAPVEDKNDSSQDYLIDSKPGFSKIKFIDGSLEASKTQELVPTDLIPGTSAGTALNKEEQRAKAELEKYEGFRTELDKKDPLTAEQRAEALALMLDRKSLRQYKGWAERAMAAMELVTATALVW